MAPPDTANDDHELVERAGSELFDEAMDALSEVGERASDRLAVTVQGR